MNKKHWYCFTFVGSEHGSMTHASTYTGYEKKGVTLPIIRDNKLNAGMPTDCVLLSVSYLGFMTRDEFKDGS